MLLQNRRKKQANFDWLGCIKHPMQKNWHGNISGMFFLL